MRDRGASRKAPLVVTAGRRACVAVARPPRRLRRGPPAGPRWFGPPPRVLPVLDAAAAVVYTPGHEKTPPQALGAKNPPVPAGDLDRGGADAPFRVAPGLVVALVVILAPSDH